MTIRRWNRLARRGRLQRARRVSYRLFGLLPAGFALRLVHLGARRFLVGALCLVARADGRVLFVRQSYRDGYFLPGGLIRRGEDVSSALRREVLEETGLHVSPFLSHRAVMGAHRGIVTFFAIAVVDDAAADEAAPNGPEIVELVWAGAHDSPPFAPSLGALDRSDWEAVEAALRTRRSRS